MATSISRQHLGAIAFTAFALVTACSDSGTSSGGAKSCVWGVDELLNEVGASTAARTDCGNFNGLQAEEIAAAQTCWNDAVESGDAVQLTVNLCIDCAIPSASSWRRTTLVTTSA